MPPATSTSVPAAAMIRIADCWSRMLSRFGFVKNDELVSDRTTKRIANGIRIPRLRKRAVDRVAGRRAAPATAVRAVTLRRPARRLVGEGRGEDRALRHRVAGELGDDAAAAHDEHAVREADHLLELGRDQDDAEAVGGELGEEVVDRALGADVDAARRLVGDQHARDRTAASARAAPSAGCRPRARAPARE